MNYVEDIVGLSWRVENERSSQTVVRVESEGNTRQRLESVDLICAMCNFFVRYANQRWRISECSVKMTELNRGRKTTKRDRARNR